MATFAQEFRKAVEAIGRGDDDGAARHMAAAYRAEQIARDLEAAATPWLAPAAETERSE